MRGVETLRHNYVTIPEIRAIEVADLERRLAALEGERNGGLGTTEMQN